MRGAGKANPFEGMNRYLHGQQAQGTKPIEGEVTQWAKKINDAALNYETNPNLVRELKGRITDLKQTGNFSEGAKKALDDVSMRCDKIMQHGAGAAPHPKEIMVASPYYDAEANSRNAGAKLAEMGDLADTDMPVFLLRPASQRAREADPNVVGSLSYQRQKDDGSVEIRQEKITVENGKWVRSGAKSIQKDSLDELLASFVEKKGMYTPERQVKESKHFDAEATRGNTPQKLAQKKKNTDEHVFLIRPASAKAKQNDSDAVGTLSYTYTKENGEEGIRHAIIGAADDRWGLGGTDYAMYSLKALLEEFVRDNSMQA